MQFKCMAGVILLAGSLLASSGAHAAFMEGQFTGTMLSSSTQGLDGLAGTAFNAGDAVTGSFWYDPTVFTVDSGLNPGNDPTLPNTYNSTTPYALKVTLSVDGATYVFNGLTLSSVVVTPDTVGAPTPVGEVSLISQSATSTVNDSLAMDIYPLLAIDNSLYHVPDLQHRWFRQSCYCDHRRFPVHLNRHPSAGTGQRDHVHARSRRPKPSAQEAVADRGLNPSTLWRRLSAARRAQARLAVLICAMA
jgi:hypothetical protein